MARQNINLGTDPNDGEGDNLRTAFDKVNDNFIEVYSAGPVGSNIVLSGNTIAANVTNANIELSPNGTGKVVIKNDLIPDANNTRYIGSTTSRPRGVYVGSAGINSVGDITTDGNITANNIRYTSEVFVGDLQGSVFADDSTTIVDAVDNAVYADTGVFGTLAGNGSGLTGVIATIANIANIAYSVAYANVTGTPTIPTHTSNLTNDSGFIDLADISVTTASASGDGSLSYDNSTGVFTFTPADAGLSDYGNSNVVTLLSSFGSNTVVTTGNISAGNVIFTDGFIVPSNFEAVADNSVLIEFNDDASNTSSFFAQSGEIYLNVLENSASTDLRLSSSNVTISDGSGGSSELIVVGNISGSNLITTGNVIVSGVITGTGASPAPSLSGFDSVSALNLTATGNANVGGILEVTGNITGGNLIATGNIDATVNGFDIGYLEIPQVSLSANTTAGLSDSGKHYYSTTASTLTLTIPSNANVAFPTGSAITVVVQSAGDVNILTQSGVSLYLAGNSTAANRTVGSYGMATIMKVASDTWFISGSEIS